jgi:hydrogenase/urease accessory protein HupE
MAEVVYVLCAVASLVCAVLLQRAWRAGRMPVLFWSMVCFIGLAANNLLLVVDLVVLPDVDLSITRSLVGLASLAALLYGLIWDIEDRP